MAGATAKSERRRLTRRAAPITGLSAANSTGTGPDPVRPFLRAPMIRLHPVMVPFLLAIIATGNISVYAVILGSLLVHEAGHLLAARMVRAAVRRCTITPYGGEIDIPLFARLPKKDRLFIVAGGPVATGILLILAMGFPVPGQPLIISVQLILLCLNLLPVLPLDGGRALDILLPQIKFRLILASMVFAAAAGTAALLHLPGSAPYVFLSFFLFIQNLRHWRFRKYERAVERLHGKY
ncbi:site-2 protease family protein [Bhargavaea ullalensis]|uniref:Stage IV sporulation protein FB n=1 Tax=Bhargavaea ullalensis TaxID=1265685 RepID=A0ABV2G8P5_9BACL